MKMARNFRIKKLKISCLILYLPTNVLDLDPHRDGEYGSGTDPKAAKIITPDKLMEPVFGKERIKAFGMSKYLKDHLS